MLQAGSALSRLRRREDERDGGEGRGVRHGIDRSEEGKEDSQSQLSFLAMPHSSPQASQGAQMARGDADEGGMARGDHDEGGMAFDIPPELLGDLDTHALIQEQV